MKRRIKTIYLKDGKQIFYPSDAELKELWDYVAKIDIEESYTIEEWRSKFVVIRTHNTDWYCSVCKTYHTQEFSCVKV